jgi:DNA-binding response OmpR family regulator
MLYSRDRMPAVFVIAVDWRLRAALRAELRERGVDALGMESGEDAGHAVARGRMPAVVVLEAIAFLLDDPSLQKLIERVPAVVVASRTEALALPPSGPGLTLLYRPVRIGEIVDRVMTLLQQGHTA